MRRVVAGMVALVVAALVWAPEGVAQANTARPHPKRKPWPITVTVRTVPAIPGVHLTFDGRSLVTGAGGTASYTAEHNFDKHSITLQDTTFERPDRRYRFVRWAGQRDPGQAYQPTITGLPMRVNTTVTVAFAVQYRLTGQFVDDTGKAIPMNDGTVAKIKRDDGTILDLPATGSVWLDGSVPVYHRSTLRSVDVSYSVQSVTIAGSNVVDAGRQRFEPARSTTVSVPLRFHDLTIRARRALTGGAARSTAVVMFPDGSSRTVPLGPDGTAVLTGIPRGAYRVKLHASGIVLDRWFVLSRDQTVDVTVIAVREIVVAGTVALLVALGLLLLGRPAWRHRLHVAARRMVRR
ncbi:hypothetical protein GCM10022255_010180 [Dactylosporangium darangshiense]|uniref:Carboxypeptidase regulatory-like domain-containing protein n=1 Tax=Dactylosporangium darangshiense TaxID=579108 RepID=A0ABP8CYH8_9ACTN